MRHDNGGAAYWNPKAYTQADPVTGVKMCRDCWDGRHADRRRYRFGCPINGCQCKCYCGKNKGLAKAHKPHKSVDTFLPDVGTIDV